MASRGRVSGWMVALVCLLFACSRAPEPRQYEEFTLRPAPAPVAVPQGPLSAAAGNSAMLGNVPGAAISLTWTAPEGWREQAGGEVRLVTFFAGPESAAAECSITAFPGDVGGTEANLRRWVGQLNVPAPAPDAFAAFMSAADTIRTEGDVAGRLYDFADLLPDLADDAVSTLAAVLDFNGATVFVKMMGPKSLLRQERDRFTALCRSLRADEGNGGA